jgi:hypothetical protein
MYSAIARLLDVILSDLSRLRQVLAPTWTARAKFEFRFIITSQLRNIENRDLARVDHQTAVEEITMEPPRKKKKRASATDRKLQITKSIETLSQLWTEVRPVMKNNGFWSSPEFDVKIAEAFVFLVPSVARSVWRARSDALAMVCHMGAINTARWMADRYDLAPQNIGCQGVEVALQAFAGGHVPTITWVMDRFSLRFSEKRENHLTRESAFTNICLSGNLESVKWFADSFTIDKKKSGDRDFCAACGAGHLGVAKWLAKEFDLHGKVQWSNKAYFDNPIFVACNRGRLPVVKWLIRKFKITSKDDRCLLRHCLVQACSAGHLKVAKYLREIGASFRGITEKSFYHIITYPCIQFARARCLNMLEWLKEEVQVNVIIPASCRADSLDICCEALNLDAARWILDNITIEPNDALLAIMGAIRHVRNNKEGRPYLSFLDLLAARMPEVTIRAVENEYARDASSKAGAGWRKVKDWIDSHQS